MSRAIKRLVVLCSGSGSNLQALMDAISAGILPAEIVGVVADRPCFALKRAEQAGMEAMEIDRKTYNKVDEFQQKILDCVTAWQPDCIVLAGYLSIMNRTFVAMYPDCIINIHPAILPMFGGKGFYGERVHRAVLEAGCKITGATVHFVNEEIDQGAIIAQDSIPVYAKDTPDSIAERIHPLEHKLLVESVTLFCQEKLHRVGKIVEIDD